MSIYVGTSATPIAACCVYIGGTAAQAVYVGSTQVWPDMSLVPASPSFSLAWDAPNLEVTGTITAVADTRFYEWRTEHPPGSGGLGSWTRMRPGTLTFSTTEQATGVIYFDVRACNDNGCSTPTRVQLDRS